MFPIMRLNRESLSLLANVQSLRIRGSPQSAKAAFSNWVESPRSVVLAESSESCTSGTASARSAVLPSV